MIDAAKTASQIRVALLTTSFPLRPGESSGVFVQHLAKALNRRKEIALEVITPAPAFPVDIEHGIRVRPFRYAPQSRQVLAHAPGGIPVALQGTGRVWLPVFLAAMALAVTTAGLRNQIVHANWAAPGALAGWISRLLGKKVVTTLRGEDVTRSTRSRLFQLTLSQCLRTSQVVACVSEEMTAILRTRYPQFSDKIRFVPNGVPEPLLSINRVTSPAPSGRDLRILAVGSLIPRKAFATGINALAVIPEPLRPQLIIIGDGEEREHLSQLTSELGLDDRVTFVGSVPPEDMPMHYAAADLFWLCSLSEGRPNVLLEAMAAGLPVVATSISGVKELINDGINGFLFPPTDSARLARITQSLCDDSALRERLSRAARETIMAGQWSWDRTAEMYLSIYQEALGKPRICAV